MSTIGAAPDRHQPQNWRCHWPRRLTDPILDLKDRLYLYRPCNHAEAGNVPFETITVVPATPRIGAEVSGLDLSRPLGNQQFQELHDALMRASGAVLSRSALDAGEPEGAGPPLRRAAHPSGRERARGPSRGAADPCRRQLDVHRRRELALGRVLRPRAADGQHPASAHGAADGRGHAVRQHVRGLRGALGRG